MSPHKTTLLDQDKDGFFKGEDESVLKVLALAAETMAGEVKRKSLSR